MIVKMYNYKKQTKTVKEYLQKNINQTEKKYKLATAK